MKINIKPAGYLAVGSAELPDYLVHAEHVSEATGNGHRVEPLHPESLVIELAEALHVLGSIIDNMGDLNDSLISPIVWANLDCESKLASARALLGKITGGSEA